MRLRPMTAADLAAVLALNATAEGLVEPLGPDRLDWLRLIAAHAAVVDLDGRPAGFLLTFTPGSAYDGLEFQWFAATYASAPEHRREGLASQVYGAIERAAKPFDRAATRVRTDPPDLAGLAFHTNRGYVEVAKQRLANGTTTTLLTNDLS